ncbi:hypothetical protein C8J57DRAFT_1052445 [Mycena rebaudengoi]|nr:hypothetical protein C8J57DRAFT_1052445 [Mycena rebaudengoi]
MKKRVASTGWIGLRDKGVSAQEEAAGVAEQGWAPSYTLDDFRGPNPSFPGFTIVDYKDHHSRPIVNRKDKVVAVHAGHPDDSDWMKNVHDAAVTAIEEASAKASLSWDRWFHRHRNFGSLTKGDSHGGGQVRPGELINGVINTAILACLCSNLAFICLAGFATSVFANWAPHIYIYYVTHMRLFYSQNPHLQRPFLNGIFSACTFNLGPQTCARGHRDFANLAFGWCAITALGKFDYQKGRHLILWDCKLVLEFPPGTTILIPSAAIFHSNIPISEHEKRYSFTQYTASSLFHWVMHGFQSEEAYLASLTPEELQKEKAEGLNRTIHTTCITLLTMYTMTTMLNSEPQ